MRHDIIEYVEISSVIGRTVTVTVDRPLGSYHPEHKDMDGSSLILKQYMYLEVHMSLIGIFVLAMVVKEIIVGATCIL